MNPLCITFLTIPCPAQVLHVLAVPPSAAPEPLHFLHESSLGIVTSFSIPVKASLRSRVISYLRSFPLLFG